MKLDHIQYITKYSTQEVHGYLLYITSSGSKVAKLIHFFCFKFVTLLVAAKSLIFFKNNSCVEQHLFCCSHHYMAVLNASNASACVGPLISDSSHFSSSVKTSSLVSASTDPTISSSVKI